MRVRAFSCVWLFAGGIWRKAVGVLIDGLSTYVAMETD